MDNYKDLTTIKLQMALNRKMYEQGCVPYDVYERAKEILICKLTSANEYDIINHSEGKLRQGL